MEVWKDIPGYDGVYKVSNLGRAKSLKFNKEKILKLNSDGRGYCVACLCKDGKTKTFLAHQLVAMAFLNHQPNGMKLVIDHINNDKSDNRVDNLHIVSQRSNVYKTQGRYSSQYKGVHWSNVYLKWKSQIYINGRNKHLGYFVNEHDAHIAYQAALKNL
jgi:hypothetical protein